MIYDCNRNLSTCAVDRKAVNMARTEDDHERMVRASLDMQHLSAELKGCLSAILTLACRRHFIAGRMD